MSKKLLFSVTIKDCEIQTFRCGGKGGQNVNKRDTGVRIIHHPSNARGESREYKSQLQNKQAAFKRMCESKEFKLWNKLESCRLMGQPSIDELVDKEMLPHNIKVEVKDDNGRWIKYE